MHSIFRYSVLKGAPTETREIPSVQPNAYLSWSHLASLVNQWYPAKAPSSDGANTKSNYKDGWHQSAWWRQQPRFPEAGRTKVVASA